MASNLPNKRNLGLLLIKIAVVILLAVCGSFLFYIATNTFLNENLTARSMNGVYLKEMQNSAEPTLLIIFPAAFLAIKIVTSSVSKSKVFLYSLAFSFSIFAFLSIARFQRWQTIFSVVSANDELIEVKNYRRKEAGWNDTARILVGFYISQDNFEEAKTSLEESIIQNQEEGKAIELHYINFNPDSKKFYVTPAKPKQSGNKIEAYLEIKNP